MTAAPRVVPAPGVTDVARVALSALGARGLEVEDRRGAGRVVVARCGDGVDAPDVRTVELPGPEGPPVGLLRVAGSDRAARDHDALLAAFARHLGLALTLPGAADGGPSGVDGLLDWDDLDRLADVTAEITARVAGAVRASIGATAVGITVWDSDRGTLRALPGAFGAHDDRLAASVTGPVTNMLSAGNRVFATGLPYLSNDAGTDPGVLQPYVEVFRIHRILSVPLTAPDHRRVGVLHMVDKPGGFSTHDVALARALTPRLTFAVELARSAGVMAARQRLEAILTHAAVAVASGVPVEDCLLPAFDRLGELTDASVVGLVPHGSAPLLRRRGDADPALERRLVADARELASTSTGAYPRRAGDPGWAALHAPVELDGERTATLSVLRRTGQPFTADESDVVVRLARLVALAWTTERYQHQLAEIARLRERERIADELHDRVAQILYAAQLGLDSALEDPGADPGTAERMTEVRDLLVHGDSAIRAVIRRLGPVPEPGLARRLRREVQTVEEEFGVVVRAGIVDDDALLAVPRSVAGAAVKIAREGMVNAAKHAGPCCIRLTAAVEAGALTVAVHDDGFGLRTRPADARGMGLPSLRRAAEDVGGEVTVLSPPDGIGTRVLARFPV
ncbi:GAF domain-containing sensor histidine kinase [Pseudonocardia alni]|uniref:GAF domain-containing sensor histidine kinase n=1 Tax=Pseudonocardia alni TaxID=33907 RepID=UPI0033238B92